MSSEVTAVERAQITGSTAMKKRGLQLLVGHAIVKERGQCKPMNFAFARDAHISFPLCRVDANRCSKKRCNLPSTCSVFLELTLRSL